MGTFGLTVGLAGLGSLVSNCIDCFDLVQRGRKLGQDYILLETKFTNLEFRFKTWAKSCKFGQPDGYDSRLDEPNLRPHLERTLLCIKLLWEDGKKLKRKYGLKQFNADQGVLEAGPPLATLLDTRWTNFKDRILRTQKAAGMLPTVKWVISDMDKFEGLVRHMNDFISDLERFTIDLNVVDQQQILIEEEIASISDMALLERIEAARMDDDDVISDAASVRLDDLRSRSSGRSAGSVWHTEGTFFTAPTHRSAAPAFWGENQRALRARFTNTVPDMAVPERTQAARLDADDMIPEAASVGLNEETDESTISAWGSQFSGDSSKIDESLIEVTFNFNVPDVMACLNVHIWRSERSIQSVTSVDETSTRWHSLAAPLMPPSSRSRSVLYAYEDLPDYCNDLYYRWASIDEGSSTPYVGGFLHLYRSIGHYVPEAPCIKYLTILQDLRHGSIGSTCIGSDFAPTDDLCRLLMGGFSSRINHVKDDPRIVTVRKGFARQSRSYYEYSHLWLEDQIKPLYHRDWTLHHSCKV